MNMDVDGRINLPEALMSANRSFSSNYQYCSQSRKMSIGVLVDSISKAEAKDIKEAGIQIAENGSSSKGNCVKEGELRTPVVEKRRTDAKDTSPWVSTRPFNQKISSAAAVHDTERTPSFPATSRPRPRSKLLEKASAAHSVKFFAGKTGLESDECREKNLGNATYSVETGKVKNAEHEGNHVRSTDYEVVLEKEQVEDKTKKTENGGRETLRMKLWEVLGNVSSPNGHFSGSQPMELHPDKRDGKQRTIEKMNLNSDTIESDSETLTFKRPRTRSLTRKRASTENQHYKVGAPKSTRHRKECPEKRVFPPRGDCSGRLYDNFDDCSLPFKRNKNVGPIPGGETDQVDKHENAEKRQQSQDKSRSVPAIEKYMGHGNKVSNANRSNARRSDVFVEPKRGTRKKNFSESPLDAATEKHKDVEQPMEVTSSKLKDQQEDRRHSLLRKKRNSVHNPLTSSFDIKSNGCLPEKKQEKLQSLAENIFNTKEIRSFKSLLSSIPAASKPNMEVESSDGGCKLNYSPLMKPSFIVEDGEKRMSELSTDASDSESSEDDSLMKANSLVMQYLELVCSKRADAGPLIIWDVLGGRESKQLSPEICNDDDIRRNPNKSLGHEKDVEVTGCSPVAESLKGSQESSELQMYGRQDHEDGLASAVALLTVGLDRIKAKMKSVSDKRSADILRAAAENIFVRLQDAESRIKTDVKDVGKFLLESILDALVNICLAEQQEQLLGIYKKFKEEVDQHLQNYGGIIEDLEEHEIELKRCVERQRAAYKKSLSQVEQEIKTQLGDAESRIIGVQELAKEKMLRLKLVVAECVKHGAFG
ncbi:hypothetical protein PHJA_001508400 [Phtheirospermum japonicum]|uniref:Meiosis-specific protein ASY3-like coiled-coil domain-containing protein n=1 Tax=Phtheirospermum japonicum TaxID=374723 RepID=A0A830C1X3_9LAMI|nr:hypothetical protein PHJA_001508400 [Phtheirospermum japonicum]